MREMLTWRESKFERSAVAVGAFCVLLAVFCSLSLAAPSPEKQIVSSPPSRTQGALSLPGGRILLMVSLSDSNSTGFAELLPNGRLNSGFGDEGIVTEGVNVFGEEWGDQVAI